MLLAPVLVGWALAKVETTARRATSRLADPFEPGFEGPVAPAMKT